MVREFTTNGNVSIDCVNKSVLNELSDGKFYIFSGFCDMYMHFREPVFL